MSPTWQSPDLPELEPINLIGHIRAVLRAVCVVMVFFVGTVLTLFLRLVERPLFAPRRPLTAPVVQVVFRTTLILIGLKLRVEGPLMPPTARECRAMVANHVSWLDIIALNAAQPVVFVSKADVAQWPAIGALARLVGTVFITRNPRDAAAQQEQLTTAVQEGHVLVFFPEGTSTDGLRVLPFKSTLMSAFYGLSAAAAALIQPVSIYYEAPKVVGDARFYGWWGDMALAPHLWRVLAQSPQGEVTIRRHDPLAVRDFADRKLLSRALEATVRDGMPPERRAPV